MFIKVKKLTEDAIIPARGSENAAGFDLYANGEYVIGINQCEKINTGVAFSIPNGYFGGIYARSGLSVKEGLRPANCVGVVDSDYRGEVIVALYNDGNKPRTIHKGDRIAQFIVQPYVVDNLVVVDDLDNTTRGNGGFGSTGK